MSLFAVGAAIAGGATAINAGLGLYNAIKGSRDYRKAMRSMPKYTYKESVYLGTARNTALAGLSEANDMTPFAQMLAGITSRNVDLASRYAVSSQQMMGYANQALMWEMEAAQKYALSNTERKIAARQLYVNTLIQSGTAEIEGKLREFEYNKWIPAQMKANFAASRMNAGLGGIASSLGDIANVGGIIMKESLYSSSKLGKLLGGEKG